jgi:PAS domain S-box-containing protein
MPLNLFDFKGKTTEELVEILYAYQQAINVNIISSITDVSGKILYVNSKFCEVSKYSQEELIGQNHRIINSGFHGQEFFQKMWPTIQQGNSWHEEIQNKAKDGSFYWVDTVILPIKNSEGKIVQYLSLRTLITEKKRAEKMKQEYSMKLNAMLHMTSHRVRKPLATCLGLMGLIEHGKNLTKKESDDIVAHLKFSALELNEFTQELTTLLHELDEKYRRQENIN